MDSTYQEKYIELSSDDSQLPFPDQVPTEKLQESDPPVRVGTKERKARRKVWKNILLTILAVMYMLSCTTASFLFFDYQDQLPLVNQYAHENISQDSHIYDRNNVLLYDVYDQNQINGGRRIPVALQDIPRVMQDALIATEDKTFWTDPGINVQSTIRAAIRNNGGASTITQQVIKNLSHNTQHTVARKLQEGLLAIGLTQTYTKAQILDMYFNVAAFGSFDVGVESATEAFFHLGSICAINDKCTPGIARLEYNSKGQLDPILGLARASLLAAMPNSPGTIDPTLGPEAKQLALTRQKIVLQAMITQHMNLNGKPITVAMAHQAESLMAQTTFAPYPHAKRAPYFVDWVIDQIALQLGNGDYATGYDQLEHGGYNIRTTIDVNLEEYVERAIDQHLNKPDYQYYPLSLRGNMVLSSQMNIHSAAVVVMNAKTGEVLAMDGGADYNSTDPKVGGQLNMADPPSWDPTIPAGRPPGTTMYPIDYAAMSQVTDFQKQIATPMPRFIEKGPISPANFADITAKTVGAAAMTNTAQHLGLTTPGNLSMNNNLEQFTNGQVNASLLQMTGAYQAFARQGQLVAPTGILDIYDHIGKQIYHYNTAQPPTKQAVSADIARNITINLSDNPAHASTFGDDQRASFADQDAQCATSEACNHPVAVQTSNTDETEDGNTTIGYTSDIVVGTWVGNVNGSRMNSAVVGSTGALPIWHSVIERALGWCGTTPTSSRYFHSDNISCGPAPRLQL